MHHIHDNYSFNDYKLIPIVLPKAILINVDKMAREGQIHSRAISRPLVQPVEIGADD